MSEMELEVTRGVELDEGERADLRDWYDMGGRWVERMSSLYRLVEEIANEKAKLAWEQGWVARGNQWTADDNPYSEARDGA